VQSALTLGRSEPDLVVAYGDKRTYLSRHPFQADVGSVIEVANTSVAAICLTL